VQLYFEDANKRSRTSPSFFCPIVIQAEEASETFHRSLSTLPLASTHHQRLSVSSSISILSKLLECIQPPRFTIPRSLVHQENEPFRRQSRKAAASPKQNTSAVESSNLIPVGGFLRERVRKRHLTCESLVLRGRLCCNKLHMLWHDRRIQEN
jgi:hypothetical protein